MKRRNKLRSTRYSVGIDEVGRGALAGPVVVAAVAVLANSKWPIRQAQGKQSAKGKYRGGMLWHTTGKRVALRDSKKLSARQREAWFAHFKTVPDLRFAIARVYPRQIECLNISRAANTAAMRAFKRLIASGGKQRANNKEQRARGKWQMAKRKGQIVKTFLDGGLYIGHRAKSEALGAKTIVKGDEKIPAVAIASIIAKVSRDRMMKRLARNFPRYGFEQHKGYGTRAHFAAIRRFGLTPAHRRTFLA